MEIKTIAQLEELYYNPRYANQLSPSDVMGPVGVAKADAPVLTTTTGTYAAVHGAAAWSMLNHEANAWGSMPKFPWPRAGQRIITARAGSQPYGGTTQGGTINDTIKPTFATYSAIPKTVHVGFDVSEVQDFIVTNGKDDAGPGMDEMRQIMMEQFIENLNVMLTADTDTAITTAMESIDRVVSSNSEASGCLDSNDADIYGQDRDGGASAFDAYVNHNSDTDRTLTKSVVETTIRTVQANGGDPSFWLTGHDSSMLLQNVFDPAVRYPATQELFVKGSVNGIETVEGANYGVRAAMVYGYPVILTKNAATDTSSRIYLLDTHTQIGHDYPNLGIKVAKPVQYFEAGVNKGTQIELGKFTTEGLYRVMGELWCTSFNRQGKIRDLL